MESEFLSSFGVSPSLRVRCPGRVNLIGEHIDYMGYGVFPMAIAQETVLLASVSSNPLIRLRNIDPSFPSFDLPLPSEWNGASPPKWHDYFLSGWKGIIDRIGGEQKGIDILVSGNIPPSSGLSSSSSLVCAAALCTFILHTGKGFDGISKEELAELCAEAERFVGTQGGGMDQAAEVLSEEGRALRIDFNPLRSESIRLPSTATFVVLHCGDILNKVEKKVNLQNPFQAATSQYNQRVVECRIAASLLLKNHNLTSQSLRLKSVQEAFGKGLEEMIRLTDDLPDELEKEELKEMLGEEGLANCLTANTQHLERFVIRKRARHVFSEAHRVHLMGKACAIGDLESMGRLMNESHDSCSQDYDCSCPSLDKLVSACRSAGCLGARLTGAGWGGCAVALFDNRRPVDLSHLNVLFESKPAAGLSFQKL